MEVRERLHGAAASARPPSALPATEEGRDFHPEPPLLWSGSLRLMLAAIAATVAAMQLRPAAEDKPQVMSGLSCLTKVVLPH